MLQEEEDAASAEMADADADGDGRRSWSVRSASLRDYEDAAGKEDAAGERAEVASVRDGSSNIGVWNGVVGRVGRGG